MVGIAKRVNYFLAIIFMCWIMGCIEEPISQKMLEKITIDLNTQILNFSDVFDKMEFIKLDDSIMLGQISKIIPYKGNLYVCDWRNAKKVLSFSDTGKLICQFEKKGNEKTDFLRAETITIDYNKDLLYLYSSYRQISEFDLNGNYIRTRITSDKVDPFSIAYISDGVIAAYNAFFGEGQSIPYNIYLLSSRYRIKDKVIRYREYISPTNVIFSERCFSTLHDGAVTFNDRYNDTIYHITSKGAYSAYVVDFGKHRITEDFYVDYLAEDSKKTTKEMVSYLYEKDRCYVDACLETSNFVFIEFVYRNKNIYAIYSKQSKRLKFTSPVHNNEIGLITNLIIAADKNHLMGVVYPYDLIPLLDNPEELKKLSKENVKFINSLKKSDNPIITKFSIKSF